MTHWTRYAAALVALSVPALAGCGHSQNATGSSDPQPASSAAARQAAEEQGKAQEQAGAAHARAAQAAQQQGQAAATSHNAPK